MSPDAVYLCKVINDTDTTNEIIAASKLDIKVPFLEIQIVLPQHESEMLTSIMGKAPASYTQDAMATVCALRDDVTSAQQLVTDSADPFLGPLGNGDCTQQHTSPEQTEDDEQVGEKLDQKQPNQITDWLDGAETF